MNTFLKYVAEDIYDKMDGNFQDTTIVFPNKRATLFFNQYLWEKSGGKTIWTPEYTTISELFATLADCSVADPVYLICKLYKVYCDHYPGTEKTFDELYPLLEMMLADYQDVDSNMVPADKIFRNVSELQDMTDYEFLEEEQREAISHFFNELRWDKETKEQKNFVTLWDRLLDIYEDYQKLLLSEEDVMVYEGMLKRRVIENAMVEKDEEKKKTVEKLNSSTYVFVGFNVLNKTERELFKFIKQHKDTHFYWDYDLSYCTGKPMLSDAKQRGFEAGMFILENIRDFGSSFDASHEAYRNMTKPKKVSFIQSPTENAQARYISQWVNSNINIDDTLNESAVVLCNENLLQPTLHSIPSEIKYEHGNQSKKMLLNVTMGYPLSETPAYSLVQALIELQLRGRTASGAWRYKQVTAVLKHPYVRMMTRGEANKTLSKLTSENVIFPKDSAFSESEVLSRIFKHRSGSELTAYLAEVMSNAVEGIPFGEKVTDFSSQLYKESTFAAYTTINRMHNLQKKMQDLAKLSDRTIARLVCQMLQRTTIPFHGEPANGLQVMGFLETRNLDFKNVIMLSAGEGQMPRANKRPSLIPYSLQTAFGMTTIDKEVSIYAYYFYRLLQRAENITILWNSSTENGHKGEMSRFMMQLLVEGEKIFGEENKIDLLSFITPSESMKVPELSIEKSDEMMRRLRWKYDIAREETEEWKKDEKNKNRKLFLSPSAILTYLKCPLQFFLKYVAGLRPDDELADDVDDAIFGDIFHYAMEQIYKNYCNRVISSSMIKEWAKDSNGIRLLVDKGFMVKLFKVSEENCEERLKASQVNYSGSQLIKHHVLCKLIKLQLEADAYTAEEAEKTGGSLSILATEEEHYTKKRIDIGKDSFEIRLGGIIDRIDMVDDGLRKTVRVVDYKTSSKMHKAQDVAQLFDSKKVHDSYHITQTLYYCDVLSSEGAYGTNITPVVPAIMYYKNNKSQESAVVKLSYPMTVDGKKSKKKYISSYVDDCKNDFEPLISSVINEIFAEGTFNQCEDMHACKFCDFKLLCSRNPKDIF